MISPVWKQNWHSSLFPVALHMKLSLFRGKFYTCKTLGLMCVKHVAVVSTCAYRGHGSDHVHHLSRSPCLQRHNKPAWALAGFPGTAPSFSFLLTLYWPQYLKEFVCVSVCWLYWIITSCPSINSILTINMHRLSCK